MEKQFLWPWFSFCEQNPNWQVFFVLYSRFLFIIHVSNLGDPRYAFQYMFAAAKYLRWRISPEKITILSANLETKFPENLESTLDNRSVINHWFIEPQYFRLNMRGCCHFETTEFMQNRLAAKCTIATFNGRNNLNNKYRLVRTGASSRVTLARSPQKDRL